MKRLNAAQLREIEPHAAGVAAVHSPETAVVDYAAITEALAQDVRLGGGSVLLGQEVVAVKNAAGLVRHAAAGPAPDCRIWPLLGTSWRPSSSYRR